MLFCILYLAFLLFISQKETVEFEVAMLEEKIHLIW